ncbi:MAG: M23 family metallopeptidase, partial [Chitinophagales bacterium]
MPLRTSISLAGNYAELRRNHFHMGLDFKTEGRENLAVYAVESGFVSRILVSPGGYGKCLYLNHPKQGLTTVYAHLNEFAPEIQYWVDQTQYALKKNTLDTILPVDLFPIKREQVIAKSGNTGQSSAPHLHFETRNMITERTINPLWFYPQIYDEKLPKLSSILLYDCSNESATYLKPVHNLKLMMVQQPKIGVAISTTDFMTGTNNTMGIYQINLYEKDHLVYSLKFDSLSFGHGSHIRSVSDYSLPISDVYKLFYEECGFNVTDSGAKNGILNFEAGEVKSIRVEALDFNGNRVHSNFSLRYDPPATMRPSGHKTEESCGLERRIDAGNFEITIPPNGISGNPRLRYHINPSQSDEVLNMNLMSENAAILVPYQFRYRVASKQVIHSKLYMETKLDGKPKSYSGVWIDNVLEFKAIKNAGRLSLRFDQKPPVVSNPRKVGDEFIVTIDDKESGIQDYHFFIDDEWRKIYLDEKNNRLIYRLFEEDKGRRIVYRFEVNDKVGNQKILLGEII